MPRIRSASTIELPDVGDLEPVIATLRKVEIVDSEYDTVNGQMQLEWELEDGKHTRQRDWMGFTTGAQPTGEVAKFRQLASAVTGTPLSEEPWIDSDTLEFGYGDSETAEALGTIAGDGNIKIQLRGAVVSKNGIDRFKVKYYEPIGGRPRGQSATAPAAAAAPSRRTTAAPVTRQTRRERVAETPQAAATAVAPDDDDPRGFDDY